MKISKNSDKDINKISEIVKLSSLIAEEEKKIDDIYFQIGKLYVSLNLKENDCIFRDFISAVNESKLKIDSLFQQIKDSCAVEDEETLVQEIVEKTEEVTENTDVCPTVEETLVQETVEKIEEVAENSDVCSTVEETLVQETVEKIEEVAEDSNVSSTVEESSVQETLVEEKVLQGEKTDKIKEDIDIYSSSSTAENLHKNDIGQNEVSSAESAVLTQPNENNNVQNNIVPQQNVNPVQNNNFSQRFKFCQYCGQKLPLESRFCSECGQKVVQ